MKITYLGTGAAEGIPALFCNCEYCKGVRARGGREVRSRSQTLIDGELCIDFPPDAFFHAAALRADLSAVKYLLVTHSHMDHFYAFDFILRGYKYAYGMQAPTLDIYGNSEVAEIFEESTRREMRAEVRANIRMNVVSAFEEVRFGDWKVNTLAAQHTSREPLLFLIEGRNKRILHLHDSGRLPEEDYRYLARLGGGAADLITFDCTFLWGKTEAGARHMGLDEAERTFERLRALGLADEKTRKVITHFSHNSRPTERELRRAEERFGVIAAYDGMTIEI